MATRGRPQWKPTAVQRRKIAAATAGGMTQEQIALAMGVSVPTLVKHCMAELTVGAATKRLEALDALYRQASRGHVAACKAVLAIEGSRAPLAAQPQAPAEGEKPAEAAPAPAPISTRLGKKEQQALAAVSAAQGSAWEGVLPTHGAKPPVQ